MKIRNMGQKYVTPEVRDMARPVPLVARPVPLVARPCHPSESSLAVFCFPDKLPILPTSDLKARGFLWSILLLYFLGLKSL